MTLLVAVAGGSPAVLRQSDEVWGGNVLWTFDHAVDVVAVGMVLLTDNEHRQFMSVTLEACAKALGDQLVREVPEVLLG